VLLLPLALVIGVAEFAILNGGRALEETTEEAMSEALPIARLQTEVASAERLGIDALGFDALSEAKASAGDRRAYRQAVALTTAHFDELLQSHLLTKEHGSVETAALRWRRATRSLAKSLAAEPLSQESEAAAVRSYTRALDGSVAELNSAAAEADEDIASELAEAARRSRLITAALALIALLSLTTGLLLATGLTRALTMPLSLLVEGSRRFGRGELGHRIVAPRNDELGELAETLNGMAADLATQREELEQGHQLLLHAQKMEAVGQLAGGIAHDFNNLLLVVGSYADFLHESFEENDPRRADATEIRQASDRAAALTRQLLTFSRRDVTQPVPLDAAATVARLEGMLRRTLTATIDLRFELTENLGSTMIDAGQLEQAVLNLVLNAQHAMPDGGVLTIRAHAVEISGDQLFDGLTPGTYVAITVSDAGEGMTAEVRSRALEPFFTTRADSGGSGLGLATVYGTVTGAGGAITIDSAEGEGTTIVLYLPTTTQTVEPQSAERRLHPHKRDNGTHVLLVEDEPTIRKLTTRILSAQGYKVLAAASGIEALELSRGSDRIDVLLTDVIMPGMTGSELAEALARERPGLPIIFMSGYSDQIVAKAGVLEVGTRYLQKPFKPTDLLELMASALPVAA
jgi:signal transduction histidine kinase